MKRNRKDIQGKKFRKIIKRSEKLGTRCRYVGRKTGGKCRAYKVSTKFKKDPLYEPLRRVLHLVTDPQYQRQRFHNGRLEHEWPEDPMTFRGLTSKEYNKLTEEQKLCFQRDKNVPDKTYSWDQLKSYDNERYFLREDLKEFLYIKEENYLTRTYYHLDGFESERKELENKIVANQIDKKATMETSKSVEKYRYEYSTPPKVTKFAILKKQMEQDIKETW